MFNYMIGRYWNGNDGSICVYTIHNSSVHYGSIEEAEALLKYVNDKTEETYQIFKIEGLK